MTDEPATVPDFLPAELQQQHLAAARQQVHHSRGVADGPAASPATPDPDRPGRRARSPHGDLSWLSSYEIPLATAATVIGLVGLAGLTTWWSWLALTADPVWWAFTGMGAALLGVLAWATVALQTHRRRLAAARCWASRPVPPSE